jgi:uncharacterized protein
MKKGTFFSMSKATPSGLLKRGLVVLFGLLMCDGGQWSYRQPTLRAEDPASERDAAFATIDCIVQRRLEHPMMHVYHYNHTERSVLRSIVAGTRYEDVLEELIRQGCFVDLYHEVVANAFQFGIESYGLKSVEKVAGFVRSEGIEAGAGAVLDFESYCTTDDVVLRLGLRSRIETYNEDDVRATLAVRDWLVRQRRQDDEWRPPSWVVTTLKLNRPTKNFLTRLQSFRLGHLRANSRTCRTTGNERQQHILKVSVSFSASLMIDCSTTATI